MDPEMMRSPVSNQLLRPFQSPTIRNLPLSTAAQQFLGKPLTPRNNSSFCTPNALHRKGAAGRFHSIFHPVNNTPPSRQPKKIHNPFEAALVERLHLPLIGSPSLFHLPSTPQHSSTQFEWTIEEVSSLNPTNVEAHETQFISIIDPEQEVKAQAAISTYFKDTLSVPSPIDCPLRNQKIILPSCKPPSAPQHIRDAICQTELTIPPILPPELEEILRPFCTYTQDQQQSPFKPSTASDTITDHEARDASLRRKLFETSLDSSDGEDFRLDMVQCLSPAPTSPEIAKSIADTRNFELPHDRDVSTGRCSSFGSLSPISRDASASSPAEQSHEQNRSVVCMNSSSIYQSTPGTASAMFRTCNSIELATNMSVDMSIKCPSSRGKNGRISRNLSKSFGSENGSMFIDDDEDLENLPPNSRPASSFSGSDVAELSMRSESPNTSLSQHSGTPSRKLRRANRRNLSLSFSSNDSIKEPSADMPNPSIATESEPMMQSFGPTIVNETSAPLSQTDSGFNEMEE